jgi:hypothetical protein
MIIFIAINTFGLFVYIGQYFDVFALSIAGSPGIDQAGYSGLPRKVKDLKLPTCGLRSQRV